MMHFLAGGRGGGRRGRRRRCRLRRFRSENEPPGALVLLLVRPANLRRPRGNSAEGGIPLRGSGPRRTAAVRLAATRDGKVDGEVRAHALAIAFRAALPCPHRRFSAPRCRTTDALRAKMRLGRSFRAAERSTPAASRGRR